MQPWAKALYEERKKNLQKGHPSERCLGHGVVDFDNHQTPRRIIQTPGVIAILFESYHQYRQMSDELNQQDRQRALIELQEGFANESRQHELDMLAREGRLKDEEIRHKGLQIKQWTAGGFASSSGRRSSGLPVMNRRSS